MRNMHKKEIRFLKQEEDLLLGKLTLFKWG